MKIYDRDGWLKPFKSIIDKQHDKTVAKVELLTNNNQISLVDFANGYKYFGLHKTSNGWVFREWAPNATAVYFVGDFCDWQESEEVRLKPSKTLGCWDIYFPAETLSHGQHYKLNVYWNDGQGERIPAWANRVVQDSQTHIFSAQVWAPTQPYIWKNNTPKINNKPLLIYECHIGMSQESERVGSFEEFRKNVLPRIVNDGYNCIQIMAIQEHPYYGSFGYHVSSFFAPSSRFGTPEELKQLIDEAHGNGLLVIMDLVHSHAVKNENEGLGNFAGDKEQYFCCGERRYHPAWDSLCFDYGKDEVLHFLLSNCKYWLDEFHFDGFRFDGVTSMIYENHGLEKPFTSYDDYFSGGQNEDALTYLTLANNLIHQFKPDAITIAEEVSGMPGIASKIDEYGIGFDYRMAMNIPDFWIKTIKEVADEKWKPSTILWELTNRRDDEKTVSYCESHDQALVGDKTLIFWLIDADMYWHFRIGDENEIVRRGIALHKMIRLVTLSTINGAYLNFMGNEFGHPEWVDFPREGNGWSYKYARRQWSLVDDKTLCYQYLGDFDKAMIKLVNSEENFLRTNICEVWHDDEEQILAFSRGELLMIFNFSPANSYANYKLLVEEGHYKVVLNTDSKIFGGNGLNDDDVVHHTISNEEVRTDGKAWLYVYIPARTALVLKKC